LNSALTACAPPLRPRALDVYLVRPALYKNGSERTATGISRIERRPSPRAGLEEAGLIGKRALAKATGMEEGTVSKKAKVH